MSIDHVRQNGKRHLSMWVNVTVRFGVIRSHGQVKHAKLSFFSVSHGQMSGNHSFASLFLIETLWGNSTERGLNGDDIFAVSPKCLLLMKYYSGNGEAPRIMNQ